MDPTRRPPAAMQGAAVALLIAAALPATAQTLNPAGSEVGFVSRQMGVPVEGRFTRFSAQIAFDPAKPAAARIAFTVDTGSAALGSAETEAELRKPEWFDAARFPQATFVSSQVKAAGGGRFEVSGTLTIKGVPQPVSFSLAMTQQGGATRAEGSFTVRRLDYRIGSGDWGDVGLVANEVQVRFKLALSGVAPL